MYVFKAIEFNVSSYDNICGFVFGGDCVIVDEFLLDYDWNITFPSPEPPYVPPPTPDVTISHVTYCVNTSAYFSP